MKQSVSKSIVLAGVGGQGILTASQIIALTALKCGFDVKKSEEKGLSQRGGSVVSFVRFGNRIYSPVPHKGSCDLLIAMEKSESLRWLSFVNSKTGVAVVNDLELMPLPVTLGLDEYPKNVIDSLRKILPKVYSIPALELAEKLGSKVMMNIVLIGAASHFLPIDEKIWFETIDTFFAKRYRNQNVKAFHTGRSYISDLLG